MHVDLPRYCVEEDIVFHVPSSSGNGAYPVRVIYPDGVRCPCIGYKYGHCRHSKKVHDWLTAIIPPGSLPE